MKNKSIGEYLEELDKKDNIIQEALMLYNYLFECCERYSNFSDINSVIDRVKEVSNILIFAYENNINDFADLQQHFSLIRLNFYNRTVFYRQEFVRKIDDKERVVITKNNYDKIKFVNQNSTT